MAEASEVIFKNICAHLA